MAIVLGANRYGKSEVRVFRVTRRGDTHEVLDLNVSLRISGEFSATHLAGDNSKVIATDTQKNMVFALLHRHGPMEPEAFALLLARECIDHHPHVHGAEVRIEKFEWDRIVSLGKPHPRAFRRNGSMVRTAVARLRRTEGKTGAAVASGIEGLVILKSGDSEFTGFLKDKFTTLAETTDRIMATQVSAQWRHAVKNEAALKGVDWAGSFRGAVDALLASFAEHHSLSLQQTLHAMGQRVLEGQPGIASIHLTLPNKHHFLVDLSPFGQTNDNEVFIASDRPYGCIEAVIARDDAPHESLPDW